MEKEKTSLERIKEQFERRLSYAIVSAIEDGAKIEKCASGVIVDGVFIVCDKSAGTLPAVVLRIIDTPEIDELLEPSEEEMKAKADRLRQELQEIETKLNSK